MFLINFKKYPIKYISLEIKGFSFNQLNYVGQYLDSESLKRPKKQTIIF